jgi:hypothetical protein
MLLEIVCQLILKPLFGRLNQDQPDFLKDLKEEFKEMKPEIDEELTENKHRDKASEKPVEGLPAGLDKFLIVVVPHIRIDVFFEIWITHERREERHCKTLKSIGVL